MNEIGFQLFCTVLFVKSVIIFALALSSKTQLSRQSASEIEFCFSLCLVWRSHRRFYVADGG